ncbi:hypothetical protein M501DRAFT_985485 [Patellaria atrata CBS 101060]|uniref:Uncharacterized protein n=1 Tax=Patellaria atrata CBS 101060 TaxID=1346257 RepID=A0A9P4SI34_9PEZI|nr:hypothetical protein M501DRAFT_985485 [Patellaria atrata CBS 101060]
MAKPSRRSKSSLPSSTSTNATTPPNPLPPFAPAPAALKPFLRTLDSGKMYITHIDTFPAAFKKRIFLVPLTLNLTIFLLLVWRIWVIWPLYWRIFVVPLVLRGQGLDLRPKDMTWGEIAWLGTKRGATFLLDWFLLTIVGRWPWSFFLERPGNPCEWRWRVGFREREVVVRVSRGWGRDDLLEGAKKGGESPFFKVRVLPAVRRDYVKAKTGYVMMGKDWDLEFAAMVTAHDLVDKNVVEEELLQKSVLVYGGTDKGKNDSDNWWIWDLWRLDEGAETEARNKIVEFKDRLTAMGKEGLFFRWIELVQYESSQPGGFTRERQENAVKNARELFKLNGIDFDDFLRSIGGLEELPGMESAA